MNPTKVLLNLCRFTCVWAFLVIILGAYTRLSDAGLGCPDWPGCYGKMLVSQEADYINEANAAFPDRPLQQDKAWKEMLHRYVAAILGLLILFIALFSWLKNRAIQTRLLASGLLLLVIFQAVLGMWTVTLLLKPLIVVMHLLGGLATLSLLYWMTLGLQPGPNDNGSCGRAVFSNWVLAGLVVLIIQIALGGWTSANYAALACPDFPTCQGLIWPHMDFKEGFVLWRGLGVDYEGGVLDGRARTAIHVAHRMGAVITFLVVSIIAIKALFAAGGLRWTGIAVFILLLTQVALGIANVVLYLPLWTAVAHNGVAALLLLSLVALLHQCIPIKTG